jgi:hypothetical protein
VDPGNTPSSLNPADDDKRYVEQERSEIPGWKGEDPPCCMAFRVGP